MLDIFSNTQAHTSGLVVNTYKRGVP